MASLLSQHQDPVERLAEVPGLVADSAQQIIRNRSNAAVKIKGGIFEIVYRRLAPSPGT